MKELEKNYYGSLCTKMYELLHPTAPQEELDFYLSYAQANHKILEPLCGSGRFLIPFLEHGYDIYGMDASEPMLKALQAKMPNAQPKLKLASLLTYKSKHKFDYIFITSGSVSLFTDLNECELILSKLKDLLKDEGVLVFAVDTIANIEPYEADYSLKAQELDDEGHIIQFYSKNQYQANTQTQFMHSIYKLYQPNPKNSSNALSSQAPTSLQDTKAELKCLQSEYMDFQTHLYSFGQMEAMLQKVGFTKVITYKDFAKNLATSNKDEMFIFECRT